MATTEGTDIAAKSENSKQPPKTANSIWSCITNTIKWSEVIGLQSKSNKHNIIKDVTTDGEVIPMYTNVIKTDIIEGKDKNLTKLTADKLSENVNNEDNKIVVPVPPSLSKKPTVQKPFRRKVSRSSSHEDTDCSHRSPGQAWIQNVSIHEFVKVERDLISSNNRIEIGVANNNLRGLERTKIVALLVDKIKRLELQIKDLQCTASKSNCANNDNNNLAKFKQHSRQSDKCQKALLAIKKSSSFSQIDHSNVHEDQHVNEIRESRKKTNANSKEKKSGRKKTKKINDQKDLSTERNKSTKHTHHKDKDATKAENTEIKKQKDAVNKTKDEKLDKVSKTQKIEKKTVKKSLRTSDSKVIDPISSIENKITKQPSATAHEVTEQKTILLLLNKIRNLETQFNNLNETVNENISKTINNINSHTNKTEIELTDMTRNCKSTESILQCCGQSFMEKPDNDNKFNTIEVKDSNSKKLKPSYRIECVKHYQRSNLINFESSDEYTNNEVIVNTKRSTNKTINIDIPYVETKSHIESRCTTPQSQSKRSISDTTIIIKRYNKNNPIIEEQNRKHSRLSLETDIRNLNTYPIHQIYSHTNICNEEYNDIPMRLQSEDRKKHQKILIKTLSPIKQIPMLFSDNDTSTISSQNLIDDNKEGTILNGGNERDDENYNSDKDELGAVTRNDPEDNSNNVLSIIGENECEGVTSSEEKTYLVTAQNSSNSHESESSPTELPENISNNVTCRETASGGLRNDTQDDSEAVPSYSTLIRKGYITADERKMREGSILSSYKNSKTPYYRCYTSSCKINCTLRRQNLEETFSTEQNRKAVSCSPFPDFKSTTTSLTSRNFTNLVNPYQSGFPILTQNKNYVEPLPDYGSIVGSITSQPSKESQISKYRPGETFGETFKNAEYKPTMRRFRREKCEQDRFKWKSVSNVGYNRKSRIDCDWSDSTSLKEDDGVKEIESKKSKSLCGTINEASGSGDTFNESKYLSGFSNFMESNNKPVAYLVLIDKPKLYVTGTASKRLRDESVLKRLIVSLKNRIDKIIHKFEKSQMESSKNVSKVGNRYTDMKNALYESESCGKEKPHKTTNNKLVRFQSKEDILEQIEQDTSNRDKNDQETVPGYYLAETCDSPLKINNDTNDSVSIYETNLKLGEVMFRIEDPVDSNFDTKTITCIAEVMEDNTLSASKAEYSVSNACVPKDDLERDANKKVKNSHISVIPSKSKDVETEILVDKLGGETSKIHDEASVTYKNSKITIRSSSTDKSLGRKSILKSNSSCRTTISCHCIKTGANVCFPPLSLIEHTKSETGNSGVDVHSSVSELNQTLEDYYFQSDKYGYHKELSMLKKELNLQRKEVNELKSIWSKCSSRLEDMWKTKETAKSSSKCGSSERLTIGSVFSKITPDKNSQDTTKIDGCSSSEQQSHDRNSDLKKTDKPDMVFAFKNLAKSSLFISECLSGANPKPKTVKPYCQRVKVAKVLSRKRNDCLLFQNRCKYNPQKKLDLNFKSTIVEKSDTTPESDMTLLTTTSDKCFNFNPSWTTPKQITATSSSSSMDSVKQQLTRRSRRYVKNKRSQRCVILNYNSTQKFSKIKLKAIQQKNNKVFIKDTSCDRLNKKRKDKSY